MPRKARVVIPGHLYHVTQRGNYKQNVFEDEKDRAVYLEIIEQYRKKYKVNIFAYCLMNNHVHFIIRPERKDSLGLLFGIAHMKYSLYFHQKKECRGHLWQGRFFSCLLYGDHISAAIRYVECNPVRAKMVNKAWHYSWSSARAHLGKEYKIIQLGNIYEYVNVDSWKMFLSEKECKNQLKILRDKTHKGYAFAPDNFIQEMEKEWNVQLKARPRGRPKKIKK